MENRFGFKELVICVLMGAILVTLFLAMKQYDRQWEKLARIDEQIKQQTSEQAQMRRELGELHGLIEKGVRITAPTSQTSDSGPDKKFEDPFARIKAARAMPGYAQGDWLIDDFGANVASITPLISSDAYGAAVQNDVLETLATRDPVTLDWQPLLAESWTISEDGLTIKFKIRRGITFSDGEELTSKDVLFTWGLINNPDIDAPRERKYFDKIESVKANGPYEVIYKFREPYFESFGMAGGMQILPEHFCAKYKPTEFNQTPGLLMGSGPYRMESPTDWAPGKPLALVRNERYWGTQPAFARLLYREVNNPVAQLTMFRNGEVDVFNAMPEQYISLLKDKELVARTQHYEFERPTGGYGFISWNEIRDGKKTMFADRRVRQAMTMLIDRQQICDEVLLGYGIMVSGPFNRLSKQSDPAVKPLPYDVARAKTLLKEMGFEDRNGSGVLQGPDGKPFKFKLTYPSSSGAGGFWERVALYLKDSYARAGVIMEPDPLEWSVFSERLKNHDFDAICLAWGGGIESDIRQMFHSSQIADGADNWMSYSNPQLDKLIDQARSTVDEAKRMPLWQGCHRILHEDQPYTFLYTRKSLIFLDGRIKNVQQIPLGLNERTEWFVPKDLQKHKS